MSLNLSYKLNDISLDKTITPSWAEQIKRWSQLDEASFILAEAVSKNMDFLSESFDQLIIVTTQGSFHTDRLFVNDSKISPSNFVHTLPNVRSIVFSVLTGWEGPLYCLSQGSQSLTSFFNEVPLVHANQKTLVINLNKKNNVHQCDFYLIGKNYKNPQYSFISVNKDESLSDFSFRSLIQNGAEVVINLRKMN